MNAQDILIKVLNAIRNTFYTQAPNKFFRDRKALTRAISRWGFECNKNGWSLEPNDIYKEIAALLSKIDKSKADIDYLPAYLDQSISNYIHYRAEEISTRSKAINNITGRVIKTLPSGLPDDREVKREHVTATLAALFTQLNKRKPKPEAKQMRLL